MPLDLTASPVRFRPTSKGNAISLREWQAYCTSLTSEQLNWLHDKAAIEHASSMAVAMDWGVPASSVAEPSL